MIVLQFHGSDSSDQFVGIGQKYTSLDRDNYASHETKTYDFNTGKFYDKTSASTYGR